MLRKSVQNHAHPHLQCFKESLNVFVETPELMFAVYRCDLIPCRRMSAVQVFIVKWPAWIVLIHMEWLWGRAGIPSPSPSKKIRFVWYSSGGQSGVCFELLFALSSVWNEVTGERVISALRKPISSASFVKANKYLSGDFLPGCQAVAGGRRRLIPPRFGLRRERCG